MKKHDSLTDAIAHVNNSKKEKKRVNPMRPGCDSETFMAIVKALARLRTAARRKERVVKELMALREEEWKACARKEERRREHEDAFYRNGERLFERVTEANLWKRLVAASRDERRAMVRTATAENRLDMVNADITYLAGVVDEMKKKADENARLLNTEN